MKLLHTYRHGHPHTDEQFVRGMAFGTFDLLHPGHEFYINEAQKHCAELVVVIARDSRVKAGKWQDPVHNEENRLYNLQEKFPNATIILGDEENIFRPIYLYQPQILFFGYDQKVPESSILEEFPNITMMRIGAHEPHIHKSSILRKELHEKNMKK